MTTLIVSFFVSSSPIVPRSPTLDFWEVCWKLSTVLVFQHRLLAAGLLFFATAASAQSPLEALKQRPRAQVLVLGLFHSQDAGLDSYKPQFAFDIRSAERQRELEDVLDRLARWRPSRIAVEQRPPRFPPIQIGE